MSKVKFVGGPLDGCVADEDTAPRVKHYPALPPNHLTHRITYSIAGKISGDLRYEYQGEEPLP